ncbi:MAG: sodium:solute symporter, partial [Bacteroidota bacterium]
GLFAFGIFTKWMVHDRLVPIICLLSPLLSYLININAEWLLFGYQFGFEILILNGFLTFIGLLLLRKRSD